jgi:hypothetical protein
MKDLVEAWTWYLETVQQLRLWRRIVDKYWSHLPGQGLLEKDDRFRNLDEARLVESSDASLREFDDLAVLVLFSVFESLVRSRVSQEVRLQVEVKAIEHVVLVKAIEDAIERIEDGSFFSILDPFKSIDSGLVEQVNQVRRYRNY